ncbi:MAG: SDR family oxidoreductase [Crocinitomicaceae bacterium]|nr:SDR family oxidoreductase [Crocinitomicaceae bacterium]
MKVIIFGATGTAGFQTVKRALEKGHKVTAFVRNPEKIQLLHPNLTVVKGDALVPEAVAKALKGHDAVISALSSNDLSHRMTYANNIIAGMRKQKVKRFIGIGGIGALQASKHLKVYETVTFPKEYIDLTQSHIRVLDALLNSKLDFTFVCPPMISEGERTGKYKVRDNFPPPGWSITSGDLADFMVGELTTNRYVGKKVGIAHS